MLSQVDLSPDGRYFATRSTDDASNSRTLLLIPSTGGPAREMMRYPSEAAPQDLAADDKGVWIGQGLWAPDSRSFFASKFRMKTGGAKNSSVEQMWRVPIDGGEPQQVSQIPNLSFAALHPDGRRVAVQITVSLR